MIPRRVIITSFFVIICCSYNSLAEEDLLQEVALNIETETENLNLLQSERKSLETAIKSLESKRTRTSKNLALKKEELAGIEEKSRELSQNIQELEQKHNVLTSRFRNAIQAIFSHSQESLHVNAVISNSNKSITELMHYLQVSQRAYGNLTKQVISNTQKLKATSDDLKALSEEKTSLVNSLESTLQEQKAVIDQEKQKFSELQVKMAAVKKSLNALKAQRLRLATALRGLGGANEEARASLDVERASKVGNSSLRDLATLELPVAGKVTRKFPVTGPYRKTGVAPSSRGTEISSEPGSQVLAIASGRIVFAGKLPGYEQVAILDHGDRTYSLYGALGELLIKKGDSVEAKSPIGRVSDRGGIYFEIREKRDSVDPKKFFGSEKGF